MPISNHSPSSLIETPAGNSLIHHMLAFRDISQNTDQSSGTFCRMRLERSSSISMQPHWPDSLWPSIGSIPAPAELLGIGAFAVLYLRIGGQLPHLCWGSPTAAWGTGDPIVYPMKANYILGTLSSPIIKHNNTR